MKILLRPFLILFCLLFAFPGMAEEDRAQDLFRQFRAAIFRNDDVEIERIADEILEMTKGLGIDLEVDPESYLVQELEKRICAYQKALISPHTQAELELLRHGIRFNAYLLVRMGYTEAKYLQIASECIQDNGDPAPIANVLREGLAWAKRLDASKLTEAQAMAREYEVLLKDHPDDEMYQWFNLMMGAHVDVKRAHLDAEESSQRLAEMDYRRGLAEKANKGDVAVQLELARRLESGDRFEQNILFAYYWYKRAQQNGGGEEAQTGLDRLHPRFTVIDLDRVDDMLENKYPMY